jgi:hypothetical protein
MEGTRREDFFVVVVVVVVVIYIFTFLLHGAESLRSQQVFS